ncbi:acyloxyacyl hydrolase [Pedobacter sp. MW01-1-1]|uniref:acyloxyacyl hydrolase n=1 Tax=Pedobacter sp. MW01-1-1 TaxID=3383027 RepID=UPI003FF09003
MLFRIILLLLLCQQAQLYAQSYDFLNKRYPADSNHIKRKYPNIQFEMEAGFNAPATSEIKNELYKGTGYEAVSLRASFQSYGRNIYDQLWRYPQMGFGYYVAKPRNTTNLGVPNAAYAFIDVPTQSDWAKRRWFQSYAISVGLSYNFTPYNLTKNPTNVVISSQFNVYVDFAYYFHYRFANHWNLAAGPSFTHFSNGSMKIPNKGMNMLGLNLSVNYDWNHENEQFIYHELPKWEKRGQFFVAYSVGLKMLEKEKERYFNSTTTLGYKFWKSYKSRWIAGFDSFYDTGANSGEGYYSVIPVEDRTAAKNQWSFGVYAGHEAIYKRFSLETGLGVYLYQPYKVRPTIYERIGLRYRVWDGLYAGFGLKAKGFIADYIEWGMGYNF